MATSEQTPTRHLGRRRGHSKRARSIRESLSVFSAALIPLGTELVRGRIDVIVTVGDDSDTAKPADPEAPRLSHRCP